MSPSKVRREEDKEEIFHAAVLQSVSECGWGPFHRQLGLFAGLSLAGGLLGDELFLLVTDLIFKYHNQIKIMKK